MNILTITSYIYAITTVVLSLCFLGYTLPAIWREGNVKNGLRNYRRIFLVVGSSVFALSLAATSILTSRFILPLEVYRTFGAVVLDLFATMLLIVAVGFYKIYYYQFSTKQKQMHSDMQDVEDGISTITKKKK